MKINPKIRLNTWAAELEGDILYFPVRRSGDDGHEFLCLSEWGADTTHAQQRAAQTNLDTGLSWADANPVIRISRLKIIAMETE